MPLGPVWEGFVWFSRHSSKWILFVLDDLHFRTENVCGQPWVQAAIVRHLKLCHWLFWWQGLKNYFYIILNVAWYKAPHPSVLIQTEFRCLRGITWMRNVDLGFHHRAFSEQAYQILPKAGPLLVKDPFNFSFLLRLTFNLTLFKRYFQVSDSIQLQTSKHQQWILAFFFPWTFFLMLCIQPLV